MQTLKSNVEEVQMILKMIIHLVIVKIAGQVFLIK
jgi:hypothetical protein